MNQKSCISSEITAKVYKARSEIFSAVTAPNTVPLTHKSEASFEKHMMIDRIIGSGFSLLENTKLDQTCNASGENFYSVNFKWPNLYCPSTANSYENSTAASLPWSQYIPFDFEALHCYKGSHN